MEDPRWLRLVTIGLVLAALAVGYFLFSGRLLSSKVVKTSASPAPKVLGQNVQTSPSPVATKSASVSPTTASAYSRIVSRTQNGTQTTQTLPRTGFPIELAAVFSASALISGWGLRKFPK